MHPLRSAEADLLTGHLPFLLWLSWLFEGQQEPWISFSSPAAMHSSMREVKLLSPLCSFSLFPSQNQPQVFKVHSTSFTLHKENQIQDIIKKGHNFHWNEARNLITKDPVMEIWRDPCRLQKRQQSSSHQKLHWSVLADSCYLFFSPQLLNCCQWNTANEQEFWVQVYIDTLAPFTQDTQCL